MELTLKASAREGSGKGPARQARASGNIPAVLYGPGLASQPVMVESRELDKALATEAGLNVLINLKLDAKTTFLTMLREVQRNPIKGNVLHVDFLKIDRDVKIQAEVRINLIGESAGQKEGGVIEHHLWDLKIEALPGDVPSSIDVDIAPMALNDHLKVSDLPSIDKVDVLTPQDQPVVSIVEPQIIELPEDLEPEEGELAEGEVPEGEEGEEGVEAPAAEGEGTSTEESPQQK